MFGCTCLKRKVLLVKGGSKHKKILKKAVRGSLVFYGTQEEQQEDEDAAEEGDGDEDEVKQKDKKKRKKVEYSECCWTKAISLLCWNYLSCHGICLGYSSGSITERRTGSKLWDLCNTCFGITDYQEITPFPFIIKIFLALLRCLSCSNS